MCVCVCVCVGVRGGGERGGVCVRGGGVRVGNNTFTMIHCIRLPCVYKLVYIRHVAMGNRVLRSVGVT